MKNPNGISREETEAMMDELEDQERERQLSMPKRGDQYMHHTGYTLTVVGVDGSMTNVQTSAGNIIQIPTGTLMAGKKINPHPLS